LRGIARRSYKHQSREREEGKKRRNNKKEATASIAQYGSTATMNREKKEEGEKEKGEKMCLSRTLAPSLPVRSCRHANTAKTGKRGRKKKKRGEREDYGNR